MKRFSYLSVVVVAMMVFAVAAQAGDGSVRLGGFHRLQDFHFVNPIAVVPDAPEVVGPNF